MENYFREIENALFGQRSDSIPLKKLPWDVRKLEPTRSHVRAVTSREATALLIAGKALGAQQIIGGMRFPRTFRLSSQEWAIENGCGQDIVRSGSAGWLPSDDPQRDEFVLTNTFVESLALRMNAIEAFLRSDRPTGLAG